MFKIWFACVHLDSLSLTIRCHIKMGFHSHVSWPVAIMKILAFLWRSKINHHNIFHEFLWTQWDSENDYNAFFESMVKIIFARPSMLFLSRFLCEIWADPSMGYCLHVCSAVLPQNKHYDGFCLELSECGDIFAHALFRITKDFNGMSILRICRSHGAECDHQQQHLLVSYKWK